MKKLLLTICIASSPVFAIETPMNAEFTAGYIPKQDVQLKTGGNALKLGNDGYYFRAALTDNKFRAFGSIQESSGSTCIGANCLNHEVLESRGGVAFTVLDNGQVKLAPRLEYVSLELAASGSSIADSTTSNGFAIGADATISASPYVDVFGGLGYLNLEDSKGSEFTLGATLKTQVVNFVIEGRHVRLDDSESDLETTSNEVKLGIQKAFSF